MSAADDAAPIRLGVLGCADVAARRVLPAVATTSGIRLVAVASRTLGKARALAAHFGGEPVLGYQTLLDRTDVDAVYIPLPSALHAEWIARALMAGKHVLAEKPLTTSGAETARVAMLAHRQQRVLMENFMFHRHSQHAAVRRLLDDGAIGTVRSFAATFAIPPRPQSDIRYSAELGGGAVLDVGGYPVRAAQLLLGANLTVMGASLSHDNVLGVDVGGAALLRRDDGVTAQLSFGLRHAYTSHYEFLGTDGRLSLDHVFTPPPGHRPVVRLACQDRREQLTLPSDDQYAASVAAFTGAVRAGSVLDADTVVVQARLIDDIRWHGTRPAG
ncbi:oxidoreductase [Actinosynnema sp. ALI-1.44]|uniref:Gfo/Idh/MocA family protein n=1 Tax=Actinosynnema sp. ALI-1.44 TaxID=1933779 RepID=UPI00097CBD0A|nr:Gfo/Idh/MocA family oxidoreductase [Actinosynnema sp. ALI-1.44]ONI90810.1 oxidoreductase [Actinosynnema sp. ALI-1.44]